MISLVHIVKQKQTHGKEREGEGGASIYLWVMHLSLIVRRNFATSHV